MKKLFVTMCVALLSMSALAQEKGDFAVGLRGGPTINKVKIEGLHIGGEDLRHAFGDTL